MSYIRKRYSARARASLGSTGREGRNPRLGMGDIASTIATVATGVTIANDISKDPYLSETVCRIGQLKAISNNQNPGTCVKAALGQKGGVGLGRFIQPLRAYVYAEQHRWVYGAAVVGIIGVPMLIGYALGKTSKR